MSAGPRWNLTAGDGSVLTILCRVPSQLDDSGWTKDRQSRSRAVLCDGDVELVRLVLRRAAVPEHDAYGVGGVEPDRAVADLDRSPAATPDAAAP